MAPAQRPTIMIHRWKQMGAFHSHGGTWKEWMVYFMEKIPFKFEDDLMMIWGVALALRKPLGKSTQGSKKTCGVVDDLLTTWL